MEIKQNYNINTNFKSLNNPIKPFIVNTKKDEITFREINYNKQYKNLFHELATFITDNFANQSSDPGWKFCRKYTPTFKKDWYDLMIKSAKQNFIKATKNPDTTIIIGRDKNKKLVAAVYTEPLNLNQVIADKKTLYIDSIAVDKKYRGNNLGKIMLEKVEESSKKDFTDSFLVAYNESVPFYKKQNYNKLRLWKRSELFAIGQLMQTRGDYPRYSSFMTKSLDETKSRWFKRVFTRELLNKKANSIVQS